MEEEEASNLFFLRALDTRICLNLMRDGWIHDANRTERTERLSLSRLSHRLLVISSTVPSLYL